MIRIEKGIPIPQSKKNKYPFRLMAIGDSFCLPVAERGRAVAAATSFSSRVPGFRFASKAEGDEIRIWRIAPRKGGKV